MKNNSRLKIKTAMNKMKLQAFQTSSITESIVAFAQFVRSHGLNIGIEETEIALQAAERQLLPDRKYFKHALKIIFCTNPEERQLFEKLFTLYWDTNPIDLREIKNKTTLKGVVEKKANRSLVMLGRGKTDNVTEDAKNVSGANEAERLQITDFSKLHEMDAALLEEIAAKLFKEMSTRLRRRMKESQKEGQINLKRTIRRSISAGGEPVDLFFKSKKPKKHRLIVLLDVSGSMDKYSFYLLRFVCALREHFRQAEAFVFSTSLIRITKALQHNYLEAVIL
ncbi:MAG: VWA domain-containing protein, partial [Flavisolibacter sp.]